MSGGWTVTAATASRHSTNRTRRDSTRLRVSSASAANPYCVRRPICQPPSVRRALNRQLEPLWLSVAPRAGAQPSCSGMLRQPGNRRVSPTLTQAVSTIDRGGNMVRGERHDFAQDFATQRLAFQAGKSLHVQSEPADFGMKVLI